METKNLIFFSKKFKIDFDLYFDLCWKAEINIQVGLSYMSTSGMHPRPFEGRHLVSWLKSIMFNALIPKIYLASYIKIL